MIWRVLLTASYAGVLGALMALDNYTGLPDALWLLAFLAAPVVGFLVGRWWAVLAVLGVLGRVVGWDPAENDGNPALWPPYVVTGVVLFGLPLLIGVVSSHAWRARRRPLVDHDG